MSVKRTALEILTHELEGCRPLQWTQRTAKSYKTKQYKPLQHLLTYPEIIEVLRDPKVSRVNKRVNKNIITGDTKQFVSFVLDKVGLLIYSFDNGYPNHFWLIPETCLTHPQMMKAVNKTSKTLSEHPSVGIMETQSNLLKSIADNLYNHGSVGAVQTPKRGVL